jgi:hypothetical protein
LKKKVEKIQVKLQNTPYQAGPSPSTDWFHLKCWSEWLSCGIQKNKFTFGTPGNFGTVIILIIFEAKVVKN